MAAEAGVERVELEDRLLERSLLRSLASGDQKQRMLQHR